MLLHFLHSSVGKESACNAGDWGSIPGSGASSGEGNGNPLQYFCLENPMDKGAWQATVQRLQRVGHDSRNLAQAHKTGAPEESKLPRVCGVRRPLQ